ncbi:MAG: TetR/AcrR family transcriptional regulator [Planctomycetes bacterium]|nr:TetR/AcrR family transcriptional regulator [Planctomycetota bacterium]MCB9884593.1 TetR/AcrR family transcriptional regulator [Planctomycetota bacterium]
MARPKEFDVDDALGHALEVFWQKGYDATSVCDLVDAMGIQRASIYGTFGDKHSLYLQALTAYQAQAMAGLEQQLLGAERAIEALRSLVLGAAETAAGRQGRRGCFCVNANVEMAPHDDAVREQLRHHGERMEQLLAQTLDRAKAQGDLAAKADSKQLASFLFAAVIGLNVLGKQRAGKDRLLAVANQALAALTA